MMASVETIWAGEMDEEALIAWGERVGREATVPLVIALRGDLGAGKTTLGRAIARGAGVSGSMPSPTYNLLFRYRGSRAEVVHVDLYRLEEVDEVWALGWAELPGEDEIVMVEWPQRAGELLPAPRWEVSLAEGEAADRRVVSVTPVGQPPAIPLPGAAS